MNDDTRSASEETARLNRRLRHELELDAYGQDDALAAALAETAPRDDDVGGPDDLDFGAPSMTRYQRDIEDDAARDRGGW